MENLILDLKKVYRQPYRKYHNWNHIESMISFLERKMSDELKRTSFYDELVLAILFHDYIYNPLAKNNEEKSADVAERMIVERLFLPVMTADRVRHLIVEGAKLDNVYTKDVQLKLFMQLDYMPFSSKEESYDVYKKLVREEFLQYVDYRVFNEKRREWLKENSYLIEQLFDNNVSVKNNINREISELSYV